MKRILLSSSFALMAIFALSSCGKEYACSCVTTSGTTSEMHKGKDAQDACDDASGLIPLKVCVPE